MVEFLQAEWMQRFRDRVNADREMAAIGDWFTTAFWLACGERRCVIRVERGGIVEVNLAPRIDTRAAFGLRAPEEVWRRFLSPNPPPLYHDFFAMLMRVPEFALEGDSLVAMQNARALHRLMNLMRE